ncbi:MAG: phospholipase D family protein [Enhydrobacter sp.]|jgi:phosphatidylserine/phosphatidylglycerophosphate/cardiolipin synthase-like enzyme|nr:MAG: phospholipase D family protein [Enhydrobacter sp.]
MIELSKGPAVLELLDRTATRMSEYMQVVICSPFIDKVLMKRLALLSCSAERSGCNLCIVTRPESAHELMAVLPQRFARRHTAVVVRPTLHAKLYVAHGRRACQSEAIVTSANLTQAGTRANIELGVHVAPTSQCGRHLFRQIHQFSHYLSA